MINNNWIVLHGPRFTRSDEQSTETPEHTPAVK